MLLTLRKRALVFEYRILNKECRIMKFNMIFPYFDIISHLTTRDFQLIQNSTVQKKCLSQQHWGLGAGLNRE